MSRLRTIYIFFFCFAMMTAKAQTTNFDIQYFSVQHGLSSRLVNCVMEDSKGLIWIGTQSGLNRFDGEAFKVFDKNNNGLNSNSIKQLYEDIDELIWGVSIKSGIKRDHKISIFNPRSEQAKDFNKQFLDAPFQAKDILAIKNKNRKLWLATRSGEIYTYDGRFKWIASAEVTNQFFFNPILEDEGMWYANEKQIVHLSEKGEVLKNISNPYFKDAENYGATQQPTLFDFAKNKKGKYWATFSSNFYLVSTFQLAFQDGKAKWKPLKNNVLKNKNLVKFSLNRNLEGEEELWFGGTNELFVTDNQGNIIKDFKEDIQKVHSIFHVRQILTTSHQSIWLSTNNGLILITPKPFQFLNYLSNRSISIRGLNELNDQELFVSTYNGFFKVDKKSGEEIPFSKKSYYGYGLGLTTISQKFYIGFHNPSVLIFDVPTRTFSSKVCSSAPLGFEIRFVFQDRLQQLWAAGNMGIRRLNDSSDSLQISFPTQADSTESLYAVETSFIHEDEKGLWVCTDNGLFLINHQGKILEHFLELSIFQINYLHPDKNGDFWMTTRGRGLLKWNHITRHLQHWTTDDGLSHNHLYSIHEDSLGNFWIPSNKGLMRLQPDDFSIQTFLEKDGLPNEEFNTYSRFEDSKGRLFLGTVNGLVGFNPMEFQFLDKRNAPVILTSFLERTTRGKEVNVINDITTQKEISFDNERKTVELEFALLDFQNSFQSKYAYKIEGYDDEWNDLESNRLRINRLPYGDYQLRIKGQGSYSEWSKNELRIPLLMLKPFYLQYWFLGIVGVLLAFLIYGLILWRINFLEKEKMALEKTIAERTRELATKSEKLSQLNQLKDEFFVIIAHDLRAPVISFQNLSKKIKYLTEKGNPEDVNEMLQMVDNAAENLNVLLDNLLNWALVQKGIFPYNPTLLNLKELSDETVQLFEPMAEMKNIEIQQDICKAVTVNADKDAVSMILRNLVSNALKFSSAGDLVKISAEQKNGNVLLSIQDSGVGIAPEMTARLFDFNEEKVNRGTKGEKGSGLGLVLCKELIEMNQGNIEVESELGKGTSFSILLPMN